jgi:hypothetical protein
MTLSDFNFDELPEVQQTTSVTAASRLPRFDGDSGELPSQACWALQNLLTRRYISKDTHTDLWGWVIDHRRVLASRLCELDLKLRIHEDLEVAYAEQAQPDTQHSRARKLLRREPMGTYASILALQLARIARTSRADQLIGRDDIHELFIGIRHKKDRDEAMLRGRIEDAIAKMVKVNILLPSSEDPESFSISPAILAVMSGQMVDELSKEFERLRRDSDGGVAEGSDGVDLTDANDAEESVVDEGGTSDDD